MAWPVSARSAMWLHGLAAWLTLAVTAQAQPAAPAVPRSEGLKVFLDCPAKCDQDFLREQLTLVSFVRDRADAEVHVLVTSQPTGGGGLEYTVQFIGAGRFAEVGQTLTHASPQSATDDDRRKALAEVMKRGLVRYVVETPLADRVMVTFAPAAAAGAPPTDRSSDPWNLWVFRTTFLGTFNGETSNTGRSIQVDASASRTSDAWKIGLASSATYRSDVFELGPEATFRSISRTVGFNGLLVKSLSPHWSAGVVASASTSTFLNYDLRTRVAAGAEYDIFPYAESTDRLLTVQYTVGLSTFDYREETIFDVTAERLPDHRLGVLFTMLQPWGSAGAEASFAQFLSRPDKYNLNVIGQANVRVAKGLSVNAFASVSRPRDQLYLPKSGATPEEILVREQQLATTYRYSMVFGFTYTFGSIFNNVVNPRFGKAGDESPLF